MCFNKTQFIRLYASYCRKQLQLALLLSRQLAPKWCQHFETNMQQFVRPIKKNCNTCFTMAQANITYRCELGISKSSDRYKVMFKFRQLIRNNLQHIFNIFFYY